ncbi:MAG: NDP-sugar synthase [Thermoplasmata archaeon]
MRKTKAVILAGGEGTRLKPITDKRPKPLVPIAGKPCIDYVIQSLVKAGFKEIIITTGYLSDTLIQNIGDGKQYGASILYSFEGTPLGTAGAVKNIEEFHDETFIVASGDVLADVDIKTLYDYHKKKKGIATMALTTIDNPSEYGIVDLNKEGKIVRFKEKPKRDEEFSHLINAGIYVLEPEALRYVPDDTPFDFSRGVFPKLLEKKIDIYGKTIEGLWMDIGRPSDLLNANYEMSKRKGSKVSVAGIMNMDGTIMMENNVVFDKNVNVKGHCFIGENTRISEESTIYNAYIHKHVYVSKGSTIRDTLIMDGCMIGENSEITHCILSDDCKIGENVKMYNCLVGEGVRVKSHSTIADVKIVSGEIGG